LCLLWPSETKPCSTPPPNAASTPPESQVEQITIALIYKFMDNMDAEAEELGGHRKFFAGECASL